MRPALCRAPWCCPGLNAGAPPAPAAAAQASPPAPAPSAASPAPVPRCTPAWRSGRCSGRRAGHARRFWGSWVLCCSAALHSHALHTHCARIPAAGSGGLPAWSGRPRPTQRSALPGCRISRSSGPLAAAPSGGEAVWAARHVGGSGLRAGRLAECGPALPVIVGLPRSCCLRCAPQGVPSTVEGDPCGVQDPAHKRQASRLLKHSSSSCRCCCALLAPQGRAGLSCGAHPAHPCVPLTLLSCCPAWQAKCPAAAQPHACVPSPSRVPPDALQSSPMPRSRACWSCRRTPCGSCRRQAGKGRRHCSQSVCMCRPA